jgi:hypothetical protein
VRWPRILGTVLSVLVGAVLAAAWLVPPRLDLNSYRADIARLAAGRLGRAVRIDGPITLRLLPEPILTAASVSVGADEGIRVTAAELLLRVALWPLLDGQIDARELVLRGADLRLPWPLDPDSLMVHTPTWLSALSARVEEGRLTIGDLSFAHIDATLTTEAYTGTYAAAGTAEMSGHSWRFTARLTQPGNDGSAGLDVTLDGQGTMQGTGARLSGQIAPDGTLAGRVSGGGRAGPSRCGCRRRRALTSRLPPAGSIWTPGCRCWCGPRRCNCPPASTCRPRPPPSPVARCAACARRWICPTPAPRCARRGRCCPATRRCACPAASPSPTVPARRTRASRATFR